MGLSWVGLGWGGGGCYKRKLHIYSSKGELLKSWHTEPCLFPNQTEMFSKRKRKKKKKVNRVEQSQLAVCLFQPSPESHPYRRRWNGLSRRGGVRPALRSPANQWRRSTTNRAGLSESVGTASRSSTHRIVDVLRGHTPAASMIRGVFARPANWRGYLSYLAIYVDIQCALYILLMKAARGLWCVSP